VRVLFIGGNGIVSSRNKVAGEANQTVDRYIAAWHEAGVGRRRRPS
jgi:hypothetical protein